MNISEATLAGLEAGKDRKTAEIQTALGESFEQLLRTCAHITGDKASSMDYNARSSGRTRPRAASPSRSTAWSS